MRTGRYIPIWGINLGNEIIPFWDSRFGYNHKEKCLEIGFKLYANLIECLYDLKEKKIFPGIPLDVYPDSNEEPFKAGQVVYYEFNHRAIKETKIKEIVYEKFELSISKGKKIDKYIKKLIKEDIQDDLLYMIKYYSPSYILESGEKVISEYQLYKKG